MGKSVRKDSDTFVTNNAFDEFNKNLPGTGETTVNGKKVQVKKDSETMPTAPGNEFDAFNQQLKKKESPLASPLSSPASGSSAFPGASTFLYNGRYTNPQTVTEGGAIDFFNNELKSSPEFEPIRNYVQPGPDGMAAVDPAATQNKVEETIKDPKQLSNFVFKRVNEMENEINEFTKQRDSYVRKRGAFRGGELEAPKPGERTQGVYAISNPDRYDDLNAKITQLKNKQKEYRENAAEVVGQRIIKNKLESGSKFIDVRQLGRDIVRYSNEELNNQFGALEQVKRDLGPSPTADLELAGIHAVKKFINDNPDNPNTKYLKTYIEEEEKTFDERNFELTAARVRHKIGATLFKESGSSIFRGHPSIGQIQQAAINSNLTPSEMKVFNNYVLPIEKKNIGTDIPTSGFVQKAGEAVEQGMTGLTNIFRKDTERIREGLNQETNTAYDEVGEFERDKAEYTRLKEKQKTKEGITAQEKKKLNTYEQYVDVRNWYDKFWDGSGDLTGQVLYQATLARLTGGIGNAVGKVPVLGTITNTATATMKGKDAANLMVSSFLTSYDNHAKDAALMMPGKYEALNRRMYAFTMAGVEGLSERIFNDTKVLDAFKKSISPEIAKLTTRVTAKEITREAAMDRLQSILQNKMKPFAKEFAKAEVQEGTEEAVVDIAQGIAASVFGGKEFDPDATIANATNTFLTTMAYSPFVSSMAAVKDVRAGAFGKSGIYKMSSNPEIFRQEIYNQVDQGAIDQQEADQKIKIINTGSKILQQIPETRSSDAQGKGVPVKLDYPDRVNYLTHRLNEAILDEQIANTSDEVLKADLIKQRDRSKQIREAIFKGDVVSGSNMEEVALDDKTATDLNVMPVEQVDEDALPYGVKKPAANALSEEETAIEKRRQEMLDSIDFDKGVKVLGKEVVKPQWGYDDEKTFSFTGGFNSEQEVTDFINKKFDDELAQLKNISQPKTNNNESLQEGDQQPENKSGDQNESSVNPEKHTVREDQSDEEVVTDQPGEVEMTIPPGFSQDQFDKLPPGIQTKLLERAKAKAAPKTTDQPADAPPPPPSFRVLNVDAKSYEGFGQQERKNKLASDLGFPDYAAMTTGTEKGNVYTAADVSETGEPLNMIPDLQNALDEGDLTEAQFLFNSLEKRTEPYRELEKQKDKLSDVYRGMAESSPRDFLQFVAQQSNNIGSDEKFNTASDSRAAAERDFPAELIDAANKVFPQYKNTAAKESKIDKPVVEATQQPTETVRAGVSFKPLETISTDTKKFQPRAAEYSQESVNKIVDDFDNDVLDPVRYWRNPEDGKDYIVSGHSRLEAHRQLNSLPETDPRKQAAIAKGFQPGMIKAEPIANATSFAQAEEIAFRSNDRGTANKDYEKAAYLRKLREQGNSKSAIQEQAKMDYGKNWRYIFALSYLNPNGKIIETLKMFGNSTDRDMQNRVERAAQWIGVTRERLGDQVSNAQENEMFDFLMDKNRSTKLDRENDFVSLIQNITGRFDYKNTEPLNLNRIKNRSTAEVHYDNEEQEIKADIKDRQKRLDDINDRLNNPLNPTYINPKATDYQSVLQQAEKRKAEIGTELSSLRKELMELQTNKGKLISEGVAQPSLFDINNLTPAEQTELNTELADDGITVENIQEYEETISEPELDAQEDSNDGQQAEVLPAAVQQSTNEQSASAQQDQGSETIQGRESASTAVNEEEQDAEEIEDVPTRKGEFWTNQLSFGKETPEVGAVVDFKGVPHEVINKTKIGRENKYLLRPVADTVLNEKKQKLEDAKKAFKDSLRKSRGQANLSIVPIDPEVIANGVKMIAAYADLGIYKFKQIVQDIADSFGPDYIDKENVDALKGVYSYYRSNLPKEERTELDSEDAVDDFIENELLVGESAPKDIERNIESFIADMREIGDADGVDFYEGELDNFRNNPYQYWADQYLANYRNDPESSAIDEALTYLRREISYERKFLVNKENPNDIININVPLHERDKLSFRRGSNIDHYADIADIFENYVPLNDERYRVRKLTDFKVGDYFKDYATFYPQKLVSIKGNRARVESPFGVQRDEFVGDQVRYLPATEQEFINKRESYESSTDSDLESDSTRGGVTDTVGETDISPAERTDEVDHGEGGEFVIEPVRTYGSPGLLPFDAVVEGEPSDTAIPIEERLAGLETSSTGDTDRTGSSGLDDIGVQDETAGSDTVEGSLTEIAGTSIEDKIKQQEAAEPIPVVDMDMDNIRATLPFLLPGQHMDVFKAEQRLIGEQNNPNELYGKAILFTNGTGTGKTLTGWGIVKRMMKRGKVNGLILVPTDVKAKDWMKEGKEYMGIDTHQLVDTKDGGVQGANITTYANFRENPALLDRQFDWVVYDESHKINSNATGSMTAAELMHNNVTLTPRKAREKAKEVINYNNRRDAIEKRKNEVRLMDEKGFQSEYPALSEQQKLLDEELKNETINQFKKTKVIFLSATPFAYHDSLTYADGYLFQITEDFDPNSQLDYKQFYIQNFGYRIRYNKLTKPESGVDVDLLERQFAESMKAKGSMSSRKLDVEADYSRDFVTIDSELGAKIDEGISLLSNRDNFELLPMFIHRRFDFLYTNQMMEAMKARWAVDRIKEHLALGRKVVVFHTYIENEPGHPFRFDASDLLNPNDENYRRLQIEIEAFREEYPEYQNLNIDNLKSPLETLTKEFGNKLVLFNGRVPKKERGLMKKRFNDDNSGADIILVQREAGQEGISLHDQTGVHPRALIDLGLPTRPTAAIQSEGRIYRTGQKSDAIIEYPILNLAFERMAYAYKIKERVRTAENLALGEEARNMEAAFKDGYINAHPVPVSAEQGKGGKKEDARMDSISEFQKAITYYLKRGKRTAAEKRNVEGDYYATPEPMGMKMVEWMGLVPNEKGLEPSSGHGAIARFYPRTAKNTFIEPNNDLRSETAINAFGETKAGYFEDLNIINKYDGIAMNPPFGRGGKLAMEHLVKATKHLHDNGRIVALVPTGQMDNRIADWVDSDESKGFYITARIKLPQVVFERAGTKVGTQILVIDKMLDKNMVSRLPQQRNIDLSYVETIKEFFDEIEDLSIAPRINPGQYAVEDIASEQQQALEAATGNPAPVNTATKNDIAEVVKGFHAKAQRDTYVLKLNKQISSADFNEVRLITKQLGGYYSNFKGNGAIPGFQFETMEAAQQALAAITGVPAEESAKMSIADRIRTWKIAQTGQNLYSTIIPGGPHLWNAAVELVALSVEGGEALGDALRKGYNFIEQNWQKAWQKTKYNSEMILALKSRGTMKYDLSPQQIAQADAIFNRINKTGQLLKEINAVRADFDYAKMQLTDPQDIQDLEDAYTEFERYLFDQLSANEYERGSNYSLGLEDQSYWQKVKENWQNRYQRLEQVQKQIDESGVTIDEKNDMVNRADRWKSIADAKTQDILREVGLSDVDVFIWKGQQKLNDSLFDRMAKDGVDYRSFNLFMYAKHAPERNAHNAEQRRQNFRKKIAQLTSEIANYQDSYSKNPSSILKGLITRKTNELEAYEAYEAAYNDPTSNKNFVKLLEGRIDKRFILMDDGGSGMTNAQADEILNEVAKDGDTQKFETYADLVREKIIKKTLDLQLEYGLIDPENYTYLSNYYQNYVPLSVDESLLAEGNSFSQSKVPGSKIYRSKGANYYTFENRVNPVTQSVIKLQAVIYDGEQNQYRKVVSEAIKSAPDTSVWNVKPATYAPIKDKTGKVVGLDEIDIPNQDKKFISGVANGIPYYDNGIKKYLIIHDQALYEAMTGANVKNAIPVLSKVNSFFRSLHTVYNPAFTITNLFRDLETAGIMMSATQKDGVGAEYRKNLLQIGSIIKGAFKELGGANNKYWEQKAKEYRDAGGNMSWFHMETSEEMINDIEDAYKKYQKTGAFEAGKNMAVKLADYVNRANSSIENATRLAVYDALLKQGIPQYKAVEIARNATINFQKKGNYGPRIDSAFLFFNAAVQGSTNVLKSMLTTKRGRWMAGGIIMAGVMTNIYNQFMSDCGEGADPADCYDNIPEYEKERNMIIKIPGAKGYLKKPMAYGFNVFFNFGTKLSEMMHGDVDILGLASDMTKMAVNAFNPVGGADQPLLQQISPTVTDPVVQFYTNKDAFGRPIYSDYAFDRRPESQKGFTNDSRAADYFAKWMNKQTGGDEKVKGKIDVAPGTLDFIFETFTGGLGQFTKQTVNSAWDAADPKTDVELRGVPILNRFYTLPKESANRSMIYERVDQSYNTIISEQQKNEFNTEVDKAVRLGQMDRDRATGFRNTLERNQYVLSNPDFFNILDRSKTEVLSEGEIRDFRQQLDEKVQSGEIKKQWATSFKAQVTKNQGKL
jgi:hypothetical protein